MDWKIIQEILLYLNKKWLFEKVFCFVIYEQSEKSRCN